MSGNLGIVYQQNQPGSTISGTILTPAPHQQYCIGFLPRQQQGDEWTALAQSALTEFVLFFLKKFKIK